VLQVQDARPATAAAHATEAQVVLNVADGGAADKHASNAADPSVSAAAANGPGTFNATLNHVGATEASGYRVQAPVDSSDFGSGVAHQVSLMVNNSENSAKLQVNPPALGPIEVRIALQGDHAQIFMASHSAVTREALQSSSPQLKEMLGSQGFGQVSVDISHRSFQERTPTAQHYERNLSPTETAATSTGSTVRARSASSVLDAYA
jgi:flagellar hook-length control protein FliK